jgi:hypothetical protein
VQQNRFITRLTPDAAGLAIASPVKVVARPAVVDTTAWLATEKIVPKFGLYMIVPLAFGFAS